MRPQQEAPIPSANDIDELTLVDENGNYVNQPAPRSSPRIETEADISQRVEAYRADAIRSGAPEGPSLDRAVAVYERGLREQAGLGTVMGPADLARAVSNHRSMLLQSGIPVGPRLDAAVLDYERRLQDKAGAPRRGGGQPMSESQPAGPGMDTSGLIREPTAEERTLQGGARMPLPTGSRPMDPALAAQIRQNPAIITEVSPPTYTAPNGARVWALR